MIEHKMTTTYAVTNSQAYIHDIVNIFQKLQIESHYVH